MPNVEYVNGHFIQNELDTKTFWRAIIFSFDWQAGTASLTHDANLWVEAEKRVKSNASSLAKSKEFT